MEACGQWGAVGVLEERKACGQWRGRVGAVRAVRAVGALMAVGAGGAGGRAGGFLFFSSGRGIWEHVLEERKAHGRWACWGRCCGWWGMEVCGAVGAVGVVAGRGTVRWAEGGGGR